MADKKLNIKVRADGAKRAKKDLKSVEKGMAGMGKAAAKAGALFFAAKGLISGFSKIIELTGAQELAEKKLEASLGRTSTALLEQARALQQVSMFGDETIIEAQALIAAFVDDEEAIKKATQATLDLAAAKGMDLTAAADLVSKTLGSSTNAMSRYGIEVNGAVGSTERLDSLIGNVADKFGGQALAQSQTMTGSIEQMKNAFGDAGEALGDLFAPAVIKITGLLKSAAEAAGRALKAIKGFFGGDEKVTAEEILATRAKALEIRRKEFVLIEAKLVPSIKLVEDSQKKASEWSAQTASNLLTSAIMGDSIGESLKRAVIQLGIMVAQAKIYSAVMGASTGLFGGGILGGVASFLFGKSPTQSFPSPNGGGAKITINQNFGGMGVIDHNFAANSIIPAINKAINTGQARIG
jgi:hypothetical protein